jgi:hypothetical protein
VTSLDVLLGTDLEIIPYDIGVLHDPNAGGPADSTEPKVSRSSRQESIS